MTKLYKYFLIIILAFSFNNTYSQYSFDCIIDDNEDVKINIHVDLTGLDIHCNGGGFTYEIKYNYDVKVYEKGQLQSNYNFYNFQFYFILKNSTSIYGDINLNLPGQGSAKSVTSSINERNIDCNKVSLDDIDFNQLQVVVNSLDYKKENYYFDMNVNPLPITLLSFKVKNSENVNEIFWTTTSEINNDYFVLESSEDAINFSEIARVEGAGNSSQILNYSFLDYNFTSGITYYRLKQVDYDKKFSFSNIISVKNNLLNDFSIYPNPVNEILNIDFYSNIETEYIINIYNSSTQKVYSNTTELNLGYTNLSLNIFDSLQSGVYFLVISDLQGNIIK